MGFAIAANKASPPLMQRLHRLVAERLGVTPLEVFDVYNHYEDGEFGLPPLHSETKFSVPVAPASLWLVNQYGGRDREPRLDLRLWPYWPWEDGREKWHIVPTAALREEMRRLGMKHQHTWEIRWQPAVDTDALVEAVITKVVGIAAMRFDVVYGSDLPAGIPWPSIALRESILGAERITIVDRKPTYSVVSVDTSDGAHDVRVSAPELAFVTWWMSRLAANAGGAT